MAESKKGTHTENEVPRIMREAKEFAALQADIKAAETAEEKAGRVYGDTKTRIVEKLQPEIDAAIAKWAADAKSLAEDIKTLKSEARKLGLTSYGVLERDYDNKILALNAFAENLETKLKAVLKRDRAYDLDMEGGTVKIKLNQANFLEQSPGALGGQVEQFINAIKNDANNTYNRIPGDYSPEAIEKRASELAEFYVKAEQLGDKLFALGRAYSAITDNKHYSNSYDVAQLAQAHHDYSAAVEHLQSDEIAGKKREAQLLNGSVYMRTDKSVERVAPNHSLKEGEAVIEHGASFEDRVTEARAKLGSRTAGN